MHMVIPYAAPTGAATAKALAGLRLPQLRALLARLTPTERIAGESTDLVPLHEQCIARRLWPNSPLPDGLLPWAAADAQRLGLDATRPGWAWLTLCHMVVHADHVHMNEPSALAVTEDESRALQDAMRRYFAEDGIRLYPLRANTWLAQGAAFRNLPTASLDRVRGSRVDDWMPRQPQAKPLRRLQNEMQMLLYTHPVNTARTAAGALAINAFWISGTGELPEEARSPASPGRAHALQPQVAHTEAQPVQVAQSDAPKLHDALRSAALQDDAQAWCRAWQQLDQGPIAALRAQALGRSPAPHTTLTLCGEAAAQIYTLQPANLWTRCLQRLSPPNLSTVLQNL
jgi:hypothetical protein